MEPTGRHASDAELAALAALGDPLRRALYRHVVEQGSSTREQAADAVGVARHTAKFHLDRLVADGLLDIEFARPPGRRGPGAGRPAKHYRRSARELAVTIPERHYDLAGHLLARAVTEAQRDGTPVHDALHDVARTSGRTIGSAARARAGRRPSRTALVAAAVEVLREQGYEPRADDAGVALVNCPFHALAQEFTDLVCGMNLSLVEGLAEGLGLTTLVPVLDPAPGRCCVRLAQPPSRRRT